MDRKEFLMRFPYLFNAAKEEVVKMASQEQVQRVIDRAEVQRERRKARNLKNKANKGFN